MAELKTKKTRASVTEFLKSIEDDRRRTDCRAVVRLMRAATGARPAMWGTSIIGFGNYRTTYASGREIEWFLTGVSPRKQALTLYIMDGFSGYGALLKRLGKHKTGKACLYIRSLDDIDMDVLAKLIENSVDHKRRHDA